MTCSDIAVLTCPPPSCIILLCFLYVQNGMTPVLRAAYSGHNSIIDLLVEQYHCALTDVDSVSALDVLQCSHAPLCLVGLMLVPTTLDSLFSLSTSCLLQLQHNHTRCTPNTVVSGTPHSACCTCSHCSLSALSLVRLAGKFAPSRWHDMFLNWLMQQLLISIAKKLTKNHANSIMIGWGSTCWFIHCHSSHSQSACTPPLLYQSCVHLLFIPFCSMDAMPCMQLQRVAMSTPSST